MMITRVYGSCNEFAIEFQRREGSDLEIWDAIVPANRDGQYVIEIYAESSGGRHCTVFDIRARDCWKARSERIYGRIREHRVQLIAESESADGRACKAMFQWT